MASMLAFNRKRNSADFGRAKVSSDREFVELLGRTNVRNLLEAWSSRSERAHLIRYEEMVRDPKVVIRGLLEYLGLESSEEDIDHLLGDAGNTGHREAHMTSDDASTSSGRWPSFEPAQPFARRSWRWPLKTQRGSATSPSPTGKSAIYSVNRATSPERWPSFERAPRLP